MSTSSPLSFLSHRRRGFRPPPPSAFFAPADLSGLALADALAALASDVLAATTPARFQRKNSLSLLRKLTVLSALFDSLKESSPCRLPSSAALCLRELYIVVYRAKILLEYCAESGRLWLLLRNLQISGNFHDLGQELASLLDVLPLDELLLAADVRKQMELLRRQCQISKLEVDPVDEELRRKIHSFLSDFENGKAPEPAKLQKAFVDGLGIHDDRGCRREIEFLQDQILSQEAVDLSLLGGIVALTRYCRFLLFAFPEVHFDREVGSDGDHPKKMATRLLSQGSGYSLAVPKDFCCPISLDLMKDPVIVSTGQTYDRASITHWIEEGHSTCPNSGQLLTRKTLVPNRALQSLILRWCDAIGISYETPESADALAESISMACASKAAIEANRAAAKILVQQLSVGAEDAKAFAARELRLLSKTGKMNRAFIAELGPIPLLCRLFKSVNSFAQENAVTALLNLSIHDVNKNRIMEEEGCLTLIVYVLRHGQTKEARENAAATLFSLSSIHDYKQKIVHEPGAVTALAKLLTKGSPRGKKDAVMALFNLSTHPQSWTCMLYLGAVSAFVEALRNETLAEEAAGSLALLVKHPLVTEAVGSQDAAIFDLTVLMRRGGSKGKENAVSALQEMCRRGGSALTRRVAKMPALGASIQTILLTGTKRARRKAALLAKMCQKCEATLSTEFGAGWAIDHTLAITSSMSSSFRRGDASVAVAMVPVL